MAITHTYSKIRMDIIWGLVVILSSKSFTILIPILEVKIQNIE